ncbi:MAG TPA: PAS domain S-box protein [Thermoanaerobaculia bacterium]|nr:PAS domain S-box protein [Thermoanaerobaculia bacterium]
MDERAEVEQALEESGQNYPGLVDRIEDAFLIFDPIDERILRVNPGACRLYDHSEEELVGRTLREFSMDDGNRTRELIRAVETYGFLQFETVQSKSDGSRIHLEVTAAPFTYKDQPAILSINRDVTDRVLSNQKLQESMQLNRAVIDSLAAHVAVIDQSGGIVAVNEAWRRFARANGGDALAEPAGVLNYLDVCRASAIADPSLIHILDGLEQVLGGALSQFTTEYACHSNSEKRWFTLSATPLAGDSGGAVISHLDITERKLMEETIRDSEVRQNQILSAVPLIVYTESLSDQLTTYVSSTAKTVTGFTPSDFTSKKGFWISRIHPEDRERVLSEFLTVRWKGSLSIEYRWLCADGQYKWFFDSAVVVCDHEARPIEVVGTMLDISDRKASEEVIRRSELRYRNLVNSAPDIIYTLNARGLIESLNPAFEVITGWSADEFIGSSFNRLLHSDEREQAFARFAALRAGQDVESHTWRLRTRSGNYAYLEGSLRREPDSGAGVQYSGIVRDVTERHNSEEERAALTRYLELILDSIADGLYALDTEGRCTMINRRGAEMLGGATVDFIGHDMHALVHGLERSDTERSDCPLLEALRFQRSSKIQEEVFHGKDGRTFPVECAGVPVFDGKEFRGVVVSFHDLTERKSLEHQLELANRLSAIGRLGATVAHEFNNVLMGIQPFADVLVRISGENPRAESAARQIVQSVIRGKRITQEILRFTQPADLELEPVGLPGWISQLEDELHTLVGSDLELEITTCTDAMPMLADPSQLHQVLTNLVINARDATPPGGTISLEVQPATAEAWPEYVLPSAPLLARISIRDSGNGIPPATMPHIFEPLFTTKRSGTGLGLAVVQQVVTRHGGAIFVESRPGEGSAFHIFLPLAEDPWSEAPQPSELDIPVTTPVSRLLLVEDDVAVAEGLSAVLSLDGIEVEIVGRGNDVAEAIRRFEPEAVVLDVGLPDMSGIEVYRQLAQQWPDLRVVFSTGHGDESQITDEFRSGRVRFLMKPYDINTLMEALQETGQAEMETCQARE